MTNESIQALKVQALFENKQAYIIPMYQRNYAWGEKEIDQLSEPYRVCRRLFYLS